MKEIIDTFDSWDLENANVLIHCTAGKSRSTAVGIALLVKNGDSVETAIQKVNLLSPSMFPNRLMAEYFDDILNLDGELITGLKEWYSKKIIFFPSLNSPNRGNLNK